MTMITSRIPEISDALLAERIKQIRYVEQAMVGIDGKPYSTQEKDPALFDLFYVETNVDPRTQAFNFDENRKLVEKASGLESLGSYDILVKTGGYHGFCKASFAEVMSQIPKNIVDKVVAFALDPAEDPQNLDEDHQSLAIIFYSQGKESAPEKLPSFEGLIKPIDLPRAERLKEAVKPVIPWSGGPGPCFIDPNNILEPFIHVGIWLRIGGSNVHKNNAHTKIEVPYELGQQISVYQELNENADFFKQSYVHLISQISDDLLTEDIIGLAWTGVDYFKTDKGVIHKATYKLVKRV